MASKSNKDPSVVDSYLQGMGDSPLSAIKPKQDFDPTDYINVKDFYPDTPGALPTTAYYPTAEVNPVVSQNLPGRYFSVLPVVSGGDVMFPAAAHDARIKALQDAAYHKAMDIAKGRDNFLTLYGREIAPNQFQGLMDDIYQNQLAGDFKELWHTHAPSEANAISSDVNHPWTKAFLKKYWTYDNAIKFENEIQKTIADMDASVSGGTMLYGPDAIAAIKEFRAGGWINKNGVDLNKLADIQNRLHVAASLDKLGFDKMLDNMVDQQVQIDPVEAKNMGYEKFAKVQTTKVLTKDAEDKLVALARIRDPYGAYTDDYLRNYFENSFQKKTLDKVLNWDTYHAPSTAGAKTEEQQASALERYKQLMNFYNGDNSGGKPLTNVPYKGGIVTNARIVKKGTVIKIIGSHGKMEPAKTNILLIEYKDADGHLQQDEIDDKKQFFQLGNKLYNYNREGTSEFVNPEDIDALYNADQSTSSGTSSQNDPLGIR